MGIYFPVLNGIYGIVILLIFIAIFTYLSITEIRKKENRDYKGVSTMLFLVCVSIVLVVVITRQISKEWSTPTRVTFLPIL